MVEFANLVRWEWFKLQRRWMPWILLAVLVLVTQLSILGAWFAFNLSGNVANSFSSDAASRLQALDLDCGDILEGRGPSVSRLQGPGVSQAQAEEMLREMEDACRRQRESRQRLLGGTYSLITPPGSVALAVGAGQSIGFILAAILTASVMGVEHSWGTVRPLLVRGVERWQMLASKLAMLALVIAAAFLVTGVLATISGLLLRGFISGAEGLVNNYSWGNVAETTAKAWFTTLPAAALVCLVVVVTRSTTAGIGIGFVYYILEPIVVAISTGFFDRFQGVRDFLLVYNIGAFMAAGGTSEGGNPVFSIGAGAGGAPGEMQSFLVIAAYTLVLGGVAFYLFHRRDIPGATRS